MALTKEAAKNLSILSVAEQLGMELKRTGSYSYTWTEHDSFVIDARKNDFHWNSRSEFGDVIQLVQTIQGVTYKEAMHFLETGEFKKVDLAAQIGPKEPFRYSLERYEHPDFKASRSYLRDQRGLSDDTIDFFLSQGSMTEATRKKGDYFELVIVFKYKDNTGFLAGASLQGVVENRVHYPERGRLKQIMRNSDGQLGFSVDIGKPKRLVFAEAPIDLMSYYELHKDILQDVRLVAMDGVKEGIISRRFMELYAEMNGKSYQIDQNTGKALETVVNTTDYFKDGQHQDMITVAVDNDAAGQNFITRLQEKGIPVQIAIPPIVQLNQEKEDWNDFLKRGNEASNELVHVYSADEESWHYQGYFSKEIALAKAQELTADDVKAFVSPKQLTKEEVHQEYTRIINQEKERKHTMSKVHEAGAEYEAEMQDNSRLAQAKRKLERLKGEADEAINAAYSHQSLTNGQPMNDKRGGGRFMQKQEQIENRVFSKLDEIKEQEERIERLQEREDRKAAGLNRQGNGLDMSVQNIPRIREEIEKAERGESSYRPETIKRYKKELERLEAIQDKVDGLVIQPETQALIDAGEVKQWFKQPNIYFVKVLRRVALELTEEGRFELSPKYRPNTDEEKEMVNKLLSNQKKREDETQKAALTPDTSNLSPEDAEWLKQNWNNISFSVEPKKQMVIDSDKTVTFEKPSNPLGDSSRALEENQSTEKALGKSQEQNMNSEYQKNERTNGSQGSLQPKAEGSPTPVPEVGTFERSVTSRPTLSSHLLYFSINEEFQSSNDGHYHSISSHELAKLNRPIRSQTIQNAAQYYLAELANSKIYYVTPDKTVQVNFEEKHFMHLTGIKPLAPGQTPEKTLRDFAEGNGHFDNILLANNDAAFDKINVLSDLSVATESTSFYFDDLTNLRRYNGRFDSLIKSDDKDIILLFKELEEENYIPVSVFQSRARLVKELETADKTPILAVFRERNGHIEQLSINEDYIKDGGKELQSIMKNGLFEEIKPDTTKEIEHIAPEDTSNKTSLDSATFTQVLDTVYNLGVPGDISKTPEEFHQAWNQYLDYAKQHNDNFDQIVAAAGADHLLDTNSDFYKEWQQDHIYKENYHVRLQWSEDRPDGPKLPFKETELISYQDFARELYKANQDFYPIHQEGMKQVTAGNTEDYIPPTKIKFDVYAPGGEVIKEGIRYDIGDETTPISQMLGLGYRRLNGQSELASMDEEILSQLENRVVNKEISQEANESSRLIEEGEGQTPDTRKTVAFQSSKQETKTNLLQRVEEILKEEPISDLETPEVNSSSIDYAALTPHELSEVAFQKVREYTETPERLEEYLNFMSKFPELSPRNVALIQEQWPGASAVATYNQWQSMGEVLGITSEQVFETRNTYTNKKTGRTREVVHNNLSVKTGEKSHITLFRPMMVEMIPVLDENGNQVKNGKGNPKYKRLSEATPEEKALKKEGKLKSRFFQERDSNTGLAKFATYKVFELSQTTLKPEFYPKAMPNRHYDFNLDHVRTKEVLEGLSDYANSIGVTIYQDDAKELRSAKGSFYPDEQKILLNPDNTPGEVIATTIHELAHASLHNPKFANSYKEDVSKDRRELEAEMTSYLVSKHFGLDTSEKAIRYMAIWTDNLTSLDDQQLAQSMKRIHGTVSKIVKSVEQHTKPYQLNRQVAQNQNFIQSPKKGLKV